MDLPYQRLFETMPCYLTVQDRDLRIVEANDTFRRDFGDFDGQRCYQAYKHRSEPCESCPVALTFHDGESHHSEERIRSARGKDLVVMVYTTPVRDAAGEITAVVEMATDITGVALMREQIRESQERYRLLFQEAPCYISIQDRDLRVLEANRRFREDFGDPVGRKCFEVYKHRDKPCAPCPVQQALHDGQIHHSEEVVVSSDGQPVNVLVYAAPLRDSQGRIQSVMEMSANITEIRQLESQLQSIGLLVGAISHSIKGLLTGLDGGRYLLSTGLKKKDEGRVERGWSMVQRNVDQIRSLVLNILFYARDREPEWKTVCAPRLLREATALFEGKAQENHIELMQDIESDSGEFEGDPQAMRSLLVNLLENSWDACSADESKPQHHIAARVHGFPERVEFEVEDDGPGMDQETREKAFTLFFTSKGAKGTGLGLFISNKIAQAHNGSIRLESEVDKGTRFRVTIPRKRT